MCRMGKNSRILSWEGHNQLCFMETWLVMRWRPEAAGLRMAENGEVAWSGPLGRGGGAGERELETEWRGISGR